MAALYLWDTGGAARELLALALRREYGLDALPAEGRREGGKPWFPGCPHIHFSLSHSGPLRLCGVGDAPMGVDIEIIRPRRPSLPRRVLDPAEYAWFEGREGRWADFYTLWTLKESRCKYTGRGLDRSPRALAAPLLEPGGLGEREGLWFRTYGGEGWRAAACAARREDLPGEVLCLPLGATGG